MTNQKFKIIGQHDMSNVLQTNFTFGTARFPVFRLQHQGTANSSVICRIYSDLGTSLLELVISNKIDCAICEHFPMETYAEYRQYCDLHGGNHVKEEGFAQLVKTIPLAEMLQFIASAMPPSQKDLLPEVKLDDVLHEHLTSLVSQITGSMIPESIPNEEKAKMRRELYMAAYKLDVNAP